MALSWYIVKAEKGKPDNRCRKWRIVVRKAGGGTRSETFRGTKTDAKRRAPFFAAEVEAERGDGGTLGAFIDQWADARLASGAIGRRSRGNYASARRAFRDVCAMPVAEVDAAAIEAETARLLETRGPCTVKLYRVLLQTALDAAVRRGLAPSNPARLLEMPKVPTREGRALSPDQLRAAMAWGASDHHELALALMVRCGLRRGECLGLRWRDFDGAALHVPREATKTDAGARAVPLDAGTAALVGERLAALVAVHGEVPPDAQLVCRDDLRPMASRTMDQWWQLHRAAMGFDGVRLHDLRHTYLTNLAQAGVHPAVMQRLAGHSTPTVALRVYTHVRDADLREAVDGLAAFRAGC